MTAIPAGGPGAVLEIEDLTVVRGGAKVIDEADLLVERGDYVGLVGPNGGGKTTLVRAILGYLPKENGSIRIFGKDIEGFDEWHRVAYVPQDAINFDQQFPLSVRELVSLGRVRRSNLFRRLNREDWDRVDEILEFMGIADLSERRIGQLSGGQKQRAFVAKALVLDPELLMLDEPLSGMDAGTQEKFYGKLSELNREKGTTIVVVSHDLAAVYDRMTRVVCVNRRVHESGVGSEEETLRKAYGDHFRFVYHRPESEEGSTDGV